MVSFKHVYKTYPGSVHALRDVTFSIEKGEFVFLTGPSGAGKTTLFRLLSAFDKPTSGHVRVFQQSIEHLSLNEIAFYRRKIGVVYQDFRLLFDRSVFENVALPLEVLGSPRKRIKGLVEDMLEQVGLLDKWDVYPDQLSGGEQQRVALARAVIHEPAMLIADEPTGNLDPKMSDQIVELLERVNLKGTTVIVATHDHRLVEAKPRRRICLEAGHVL